MQRLSVSEVEERFKALEGWELNDNVLTKDFGFKGFSTAMEFMNRLAPVAEKLDHHPDWSNSYNRVTISLTSHEAHGLTKHDFAFAAAADEVAQQLRR